ncbi:MAG: DUF1015 family protein [Acidobacteriota bacterium]
MAQVAWFRGALWDRSKVELAAVAAAPITGVKDRLARGELVRDPTRALYRYHQQVAIDGRTVTRKMLIAAVRLEPWSEGIIRAHEATDAHARDAAIAGIAAEAAHTTPVFAGYRDAAGELDRMFRRLEDGRATVDVTTKDGTRHRLWTVANAEIAGKVRTLFAPKKLHVLDGHARYEGMLAYRDQVGANATMYSSAKFGLACLVNVDDPGLIVAARHRIVRGTDVQRDRVLDDAKAYFVVEKLAGAAKDVGKQRAALADTLAHQPAFVAVFAGDPDAWKLTLSPDVAPTAVGVQIDRALQKYDPVVVDQLFLSRVIAGAAHETTLDHAEALRAVDAGAAAALIVRPLAIDQVLRADELGQLLPFGSTAFVPPLANLVVYVVDPDEDVI